MPSGRAGFQQSSFLKSGRRFLILPEVEVRMPDAEGKVRVGTLTAVEQCCVYLDGGLPVFLPLKK